MNTFKLETPCIIKQLKDHTKIKHTLISLIKNTKADYLESKNKYYGDLIHRLDWNSSKDYSREWVNSFNLFYKNTLIIVQLN